MADHGLEDRDSALSVAAFSTEVLDIHQPSTNFSGRFDIPKAEAQLNLTVWTEGVFESLASSDNCTGTNFLDFALRSLPCLPPSNLSYTCLNSAMFGNENASIVEANTILGQHNKFLKQTVMLLLQHPTLLYLDLLESSGTNMAEEMDQRNTITVGQSMYLRQYAFIYAVLMAAF